MRILHVDSSILGGHSVSRQISGEVLAKLREQHPDATLVERDLGAEPLAHLDLGNNPTVHPLTARTGGTANPARDASDAALQEFLDADLVVVGAPMYNFSVPSQLKAWIDRILVPGTTFAYVDGQPQGLMGGKRVVVAVARGGFYGQGAPAHSLEHLESYLRTVFGFIGITDLDVIVAEGLAGGDDAKTEAVAKASAAVRELRAA